MAMFLLGLFLGCVVVFVGLGLWALFFDDWDDGGL